MTGYFSHSALRRAAYIDVVREAAAQAQKAAQEAEEPFSEPDHQTPFDRASKTRFLVKGKVCKRIKNSWDFLGKSIQN